MKLRVIQDEGDLIAIDKPAGLPSTGKDLEDPDCAQWVLQEQLGHRVWAVHQIDKGTSGVLLFVRRKKAVAEWQSKLRAGSKTYLAIVHGVPPWEKMKVDAPITTTKGHSVVDPDGKAAQTTLHVEKRGDEHSVLLARPHTGRTHQIRVHAAHVGHPLVGERVYRDPPCTLLPRHALHAWRIKAAGRKLEAELPEDMVTLRDAI